MSYDFAQIIKLSSGEEVMIKFTIKSEYKEGKKNKKILSGTDESGNTYSAIGVNDDNYKINATEVVKA